MPQTEAWLQFPVSLRCEFKNVWGLVFP